jgi:arabinogalactan oligomer/maltooligosaccharide transport system permease protein
VFLVAFQIAPVLYTVNVAFTNYSTGHILTRSEAISGIERNSLQQPENGKTYTMAVARDSRRHLVLLLQDEQSGDFSAGTEKGLTPLSKSDVTVKAGAITAAKGYTIVTGAALFSLDKQISAFRVPAGGSAAIQPQGFANAVALEPTLRYDSRRGVFVRISDGIVFRANGRGSFVNAGNAKEELEPGWKTYTGFRNFSRIIHDPLVKGPFLRVFGWTFAFATLTVLLSFAIGLFIAIALDKPQMMFQRTYRSILVLPYAIPGFLSLLIWGGLLNDDFGVVNRSIIHPIFGTDVPWLFDPNWAKVSCIIVSVWLTTPYFFLVSLGALQSIPKELVEAAKVDGGGPLQIFRRVTLPLLLVAVAPLLIASFAFNFNNFNNIFLLTGGGPQVGGQNIAGGTDILISYTYKLAFSAGKGQDYGLASAVAIVIFFIVASISAVAFWRSKSLENVR